MRRRQHAVLSRTIAIPQRNVWVLFQKKTDMFGGQLLAANEALPQAAKAVRTFVHKEVKSEVVSQRESTPLTWIRSRRASGSRWASSTSAEVPPLVSWPHSSNAYISQGSGAACGIT